MGVGVDSQFNRRALVRGHKCHLRALVLSMCGILYKKATRGRLGVCSWNRGWMGMRCGSFGLRWAVEMRNEADLEYTRPPIKSTLATI